MGFDLMSVMTEEAKNPQRTVPISITLTILIITFFYVMTCIALYGVCELHLMEDSDIAVAQCFESINVNWMGCVVSLAAFTGISVTTFNQFLPIPRVLQEQAKDGLM